VSALAAVLALFSVLVRLGLLVGFLVSVAGIGWLLWDCTYGPSARAARAARRRARGVWI